MRFKADIVGSNIAAYSRRRPSTEASDGDRESGLLIRKSLGWLIDHSAADG